MSETKQKDESRYSVGIDKGSLEVELLRNYKAARASFKFNMVDFHAEPKSPLRNVSERVCFDIISLFVHPGKNEPVKMHLVPPRNNRIWEAVKEVHGRGGEVMYGSNHSLRLDQSGQVIRYGMKTAQVVQDPDTRIDQPFFENKANAIRAILEFIKQHSAVGGTELVNFNLVSDDALLDIGFSRVPDFLSRRLPMWYGNPEKSFSRGDGGYEDRHSRDQNIASFLKVMQDEVARGQSTH